jgi:glutathione S-transferase
MKLYAHPMSTCTRKVLCTLAEKGAQADFVLVDIMKGDAKKPEHLARQPFGQVPAFEDGDFKLYESRAIIRYLDETLPGTALRPADAKGRAKMEQFISVEQSNFTPPAMKIIMQAFFGPMMGKQPDDAIVNEGKAGVNRALDVLDAALAGNDYLLGKQFTLADICYMPYIEYLYAAGAGDELVGKRPNVGPWWRRISERASWQKAIGK